MLNIVLTMGMAFWLLFPAPGATADSGLQVTCNLTGQLAGVRGKELLLFFSEDMTALGEARAMDSLVAITPPTAGKFHWRGTSTLAFIPDKRWRYSTVYRVRLAAGLQALSGGTLSGDRLFEFRTPVRYPGVACAAENGGWRTLESKKDESPEVTVHPHRPLRLKLDTPLGERELRARLQVRDEKGRNLECRITMEEAGVFSVTCPQWQWGREYEMRIAGYRVPLEGPEGGVQDWLCNVCILREFTVDRAMIDRDWLRCSMPGIPVDRNSVKIWFTQPTGELSGRHFRLFEQAADGTSRELELTELERIDEESVKLSWKDQVPAGREIEVRPSTEIRSRFGDPLTHTRPWRIPVVSLDEPHFQLEPSRGESWLHLFTCGVKEAEYSLWRFSPLGLAQCLRIARQGRPGALTDLEAGGAVERSKRFTVRFATDQPRHRIVDPMEQVGAATGFFGVLPERLVPFHGRGEAAADQAPPLDKPLQLLHRSEMEMVLKSHTGGSLVWIYDLRRRCPLAGAAVHLLRRGSEELLGYSDTRGGLEIAHGFQDGDVLTATHPDRPDRAFLEFTRQKERERQKESYRVFLFTDKYLYQAGERLEVSGIVRDTKRGRLDLPDGVAAELLVKSPQQAVCHREPLTLDAWGGFHVGFTIPVKWGKGRFTLALVVAGRELSGGGFTVDSFSRHTMACTFNGLESISTPMKPARLQVTGRYLSGNPMAGETLSYRLTWKNNEWDPWSYRSFNRLGQSYDFHLHNVWQTLPAEITGQEHLDEQGRFALTVDWRRHPLPRGICGVHGEITVSSREGKEISAFRSSVLIPGKRLVGIGAAHRGVKTGNDVHWTVPLIMVDASGWPVSGRVRARIFVSSVSWETDSRPREYLDLGERVLSGKGELAFSLPLEITHFHVLCEARDDEDGITASSRWMKGHETEEEEDDEPLRIVRVREKPALSGGGRELRVFLVAKVPMDLLATLENQRVLGWGVGGGRGGLCLSLPWPAGDEKQACLQVRGQLADGEVVTVERKVTAASWSRKRLRVEVHPLHRETRPGRRETIRLQVLDASGAGRRARVVVWAEDEGVLSLTADSPLPDPHRYFTWFPWAWQADECVAKRNHEWTLPFPRMVVPDAALLVYGRVSDEDGRAIAGAEVSLSRRGRPVARQTTSALGYYVFPLPADDSYRLDFSARGYLSGSRWLSTRDLSSRGACELSVRLAEKCTDPYAAPLSLPEYIRSLRGTAVTTDGRRLVHTRVTLSAPGVERETHTDRHGAFQFAAPPKGKCVVRIEGKGFATRIGKMRMIHGGRLVVRLELAVAQFNEDIVVMGGPGVVETRRASCGISVSKEDPGRLAPGDSAVEPRWNESPLLFYRVVDTDAAGRAEFSFPVTDLLSNFRIRAVAYNAEEYGNGESSLLVSKRLFVEEAMPEFAREGDRFSAGMRVCNRTARELPITAGVRAGSAVLLGTDDARLRVGPGENRPHTVSFSAAAAGEGEVILSAHSTHYGDALRKKIPITERTVSECLVDFSRGSSLHKRVHPPPEAEQARVQISLASSLLKPWQAIADRLLAYPYECLEQRTSRIMPFLLFGSTMESCPELRWDRPKVEAAVMDYLARIEEHFTSTERLAYYPGGRPSSYLTLYVLWAMQLAGEQGWPVDKEVMRRLLFGLRDSLRQMPDDDKCFFFFVTATGQEQKEVAELFARRWKLSVWARAFLYRTLARLHMDGAMLTVMRREFDQRLQVEADFAYFAGDERDARADMPFHSSRYVTALLLQAILEVDGSTPYTERMIQWLLETPAWEWNTTQTNFWVLYALHTHMRGQHTSGPLDLRLKLNGETLRRRLAQPGETMTLERPLAPASAPMSVEVEAERPIYLTTRLHYREKAGAARDAGIAVQRRVYAAAGKPVDEFRRGEVYRVEILLRSAKEVPYVVVEEPLAAGFEVLRTDLAGGRRLDKAKTPGDPEYTEIWARMEHSADRVVFYTYESRPKSRLTYFVKALYSGEFTWLPTEAAGMYHPQYGGREAVRRIHVE